MERDKEKEAHTDGTEEVNVTKPCVRLSDGSWQVHGTGPGGHV